MRIANAQYGSDTGMYLVDVVLETSEEEAMDQPAVWRALTPLFEAQGIHPDEVVDIFVYTTDQRGDLTPWPK